MGALQTIERYLWPQQRQPESDPSRSFPLSLDDFFTMMFGGVQYPITGLNQSQAGKSQEQIAPDYVSLAALAYMANPIVAACMDVRMLLFSEARFQFRQLRSGRPGDLFGTAELKPLEEPWPGGTTADLLSRALQDVDLAGNYFAARRPGNRLFRMRPDWVAIIVGSFDDAEVLPGDADSEVLGYLYQPGGPGSGRPPQVFARTEVCHFTWKPDPLAQYRGMSWLTPVIREVMADQATTDSKLNAFDHGMTPNLLFKFDRTYGKEVFDAAVQKLKAGHEGPSNRNKAIFLGAGIDVTPIGATLQESDFAAVQGAGETRIANAAQVPAPVGGFREGLQGSSLNAGNYQASFRRFADLTMRPLWRNFAGSMQTLIPPPEGSQLWYDDRDIPALRENVADAAAVQAQQAAAMATLAKEGWDPASVVEAIDAGDWKRLKHSGLLSVQLQPPGSQPATNGASNGSPPVPAQTARALAEQLSDRATKDGEGPE